MDVLSSWLQGALALSPLLEDSFLINLVHPLWVGTSIAFLQVVDRWY
jgi:hypothetical protein